MISDINKVGQSSFVPEISQKQAPSKEHFESLSSFDEEDQAIISAEAQMQYELEKFNSGGDNLLQLVGASVNAKFTAQAEARVVDTKKEMLNTILDMGES